jgi:uncharacterized membrane protein
MHVRRIAEHESDARTEIVLGNLLRSGVILATTVIFLGGVIYLVRHGGEAPDYRAFHGEPSDLRSVGGIVLRTLALRGRGIIQLGLLLLIATPVMRVLCSVAAFALQRDPTYVVVTLTVLTFLLTSLFGGLP